MSENVIDGGAGRCTRSPPINRVRKTLLPMPRVKTNSAIGVGRKLKSMDCTCHQASNRSGSRAVASEGNKRFAPPQSDDQSSPVAASNPKPTTHEERSLGVT